MTQEQIDRGNKIIAKFMGNNTIQVNIPFLYEIGEILPVSGNICKTTKDGEDEVRLELDENNINGVEVELSSLSYYSSWDWLVPVVEKIEQSCKANICIWIKNCLIDYYGVHDDPPMWDTRGESKIEAVYKAVVSFIKWYNKNIKNA